PSFIALVLLLSSCTFNAVEQDSKLENYFHPMVIAAREALSKVPESAIVSAYHPLTAQLARRERIYAFPVPFKRALYGLDAFAAGDVLPFVDEIEFVVLPTNMDDQMREVWSSVASDFEIAYANSWWVVFQRKAK
ncbi:MAG: hypothetical protein ACO24N_01470, partial [Ilumatobacteraceae bacterium]